MTWNNSYYKTKPCNEAYNILKKHGFRKNSKDERFPYSFTLQGLCRLSIRAEKSSDNTFHVCILNDKIADLDAVEQMWKDLDIYFQYSKRGISLSGWYCNDIESSLLNLEEFCNNIKAYNNDKTQSKAT